MTFPELLIQAIRKSEIPLRFEPGAEEAVAEPVTEFLKAWIESHDRPEVKDDYDRARRALIRQLLDELNGAEIAE